MYTRISIIANGVLDAGVLLELRKTDYIIGVDLAAFWLLSHGISPNLAIGDFDSCNEEEVMVIQQKITDIRAFSPEKDFTDTELAFEEALKMKPKEICILGGWGTRMDHMLAVLSLLEKGLRRKISVHFKNSTNDITLLSRGRTILTKRGDDKYISIIPYSTTISLTIVGLKYPLNHAPIVRGQTIGISNEFIGTQATVTMHSGLALLIRSRD